VGTFIATLGHVSFRSLKAMTSIALYRSADLRLIEAAAAGQPLMQRAGQAAADLAQRLCSARGSAILILAGPGNNGGDALVTARLLRALFFEVQLVFIGDAANLPRDAAAAYQAFITAGGQPLTAIPADRRYALIIDGLFGIGLRRDISEPFASLIDTANTLAARDCCPLLALDCPSGLDSDTGTVHGTAIRATHTLTFLGGKPGLFTADGPDLCGEIHIATLGLDAAQRAQFGQAPGLTIGFELFSDQAQARRRNSHKGLYGNAGILGGDHGMVGAALLAARAALRLGSGRVYVGLLEASAPAVDLGQPELMLRSAEQLLATELTPLTVLACGPGLGQRPQAGALLARACLLDIPLVLDADALNLIAGDSALQKALNARQAPTVLTPHPTEAARLLGSSTAIVQADRLGAARELAARFKACVVLKGNGSVVSTADGAWFINTSGNPGLATAGSGDVLTGFVSALLAQGWPELEALLAAVHLHGLAAEHCVAQGCGPVGLTAGELIDSARTLFNHWLSTRQAG
jgi:hydroxyethylthiazole kinase-like uncharacterized protein yjeF